MQTGTQHIYTHKHIDNAKFSDIQEQFAKLGDAVAQKIAEKMEAEGSTESNPPPEGTS